MDWHVLFNHQKAIVKVYWDAQLAQAAGHNGDILTAKQNKQ